MNFLPATVSNGASLKLPFGEFRLDERRAQAVGDKDLVLVGVRPEYFEDASLVDDAKRDHGVTFTARVDVTEWLGDAQYAYIPFDAADEVTAQLRDLSRELDSDQLRTQAVVVHRRRRAGSATVATPSSGWTRARCTCSTPRPARTSPATPRPAPSSPASRPRTARRRSRRRAAGADTPLVRHTGIPSTPGVPYERSCPERPRAGLPDRRSCGMSVPGWPEVFRGSVAVAAGLVTAARLRGPSFQRLFPDVYAPADR